MSVFLWFMAAVMFLVGLVLFGEWMLREPEDEDEPEPERFNTDRSYREDLVELYQDKQDGRR